MTPFGLKIPQRLFGPNQGGKGGGQAGGKDGLGGGGGMKGGGGGKGSDGWGGGGGKTQPRDPAGPQGAISGGHGIGPGARNDGRPTDNTRTTSFLDSLFGYDTFGRRREAYNNNPNPAGRNTSPVAMVPNFPYASGVYTAAAALDVLSGMNPLGAVKSAANTIVTGNPGTLSSLAESAGYGKGPQEGDIGVGHDLGGKGGALGGGFGGYTPPKPTSSLTPVPTPTTPLPNPAAPGGALQQVQYPGMYQNVPGPSPYGYQIPYYNYWAK